MPRWICPRCQSVHPDLSMNCSCPSPWIPSTTYTGSADCDNCKALRAERDEYKELLERNEGRVAKMIDQVLSERVNALEHFLDIVTVQLDAMVNKALAITGGSTSDSIPVEIVDTPEFSEGYKAAAQILLSVKEEALRDFEKNKTER